MYELTPAQKARIDQDCTYHAPTPDQVERYNKIRAMHASFMTLIFECTPVSREQSVALNKLDGVVMSANAAIARNEKPG